MYVYHVRILIILFHHLKFSTHLKGIAFNLVRVQYLMVGIGSIIVDNTLAFGTVLVLGLC